MKAILTYHSIDDSGSVISVAEATFRAQVAWLASSGIPVVPLREIAFLPEDASAIALTFDDGLESFGRVAQPILADAGLPATLYVVSSLVGQRSVWSGGVGGMPTFDLMDWDQLGAAVESGLVAMGGHTRTHPRLPCIGTSEAEDEILGCADDIERRLGVRPTSFAYPYGYLDDRAVELAATTYATAVTTTHDVLTGGAGPLRLPRLDMWYFRNRTGLHRFDTLAFLASVRTRRLARSVRRATRGGPCD